MVALLYILLQAPESWLVNLPSTIGVASILGFFVWYFMSEKKKDDQKHDDDIKAEREAHKADIKALTDRYEAAIEKLRAEQNTERQIYRDRIDSLIEKISEITRKAIDSNNQLSVILNDVKEGINELRNKK